MKKKENKKTLLVGEGIHQHTLYGEFTTEEKITDFAPVKVKKDCVLRHEKPDGRFSNEHKPLKVDKGEWVMGKQVEYNPFDQKISRVWD